MDTKSLAHSAPQSTRELRALAIAEEHFETIAKSYRRGEYLVPSCSSRGSYRVTYTSREESCGCNYWEFGNICKHVLAVAIVAAKTGVCSGCSERVRHRGLIELVEDNHDNLTYFEGDMLCWECADNAGVCY